MKFWIKICAVALLIFACKVQAFSFVSKTKSTLSNALAITVFPDYFPFGYRTTEDPDITDVTGSVFRDVMTEMVEPDEKKYLIYRYFDTAKDGLRSMKSGEIQGYMGAFYAMDNFDFMFPAMINNPVHLMTVPDKIGDIKNVDDLKKHKGIYLQNEPFSAHILNIFEQLALKPVDNPDEAYRQLLVGEADYMIGSYYYQYALILDRGLRGYIAFSSRPLWNMPMFLAFSKNTKNKKAVRDYFRSILNQGFAEKVLERIKFLIHEKEEQTTGIVPPSYVNTSVSDELTPADEMVKEEQK